MTEMADLRDLRAKVTAETDTMLDAVSRATGKDKSEIVREVLHEWYLSKWHEATIIGRLFRGREGSGAASEGGTSE